MRFAKLSEAATSAADVVFERRDGRAEREERKEPREAAAPIRRMEGWRVKPSIATASCGGEVSFYYI